MGASKGPCRLSCERGRKRYALMIGVKAKTISTCLIKKKILNKIGKRAKELSTIDLS